MASLLRRLRSLVRSPGGRSLLLSPGDCCCEPPSCDYFLRAHVCNPGDCASPAMEAYVCRIVPECQNDPFPHRALTVGDIVLWRGVCFRIDSLDKYSPLDPPPEGMLPIPLGGQVLLPTDLDPQCFSVAWSCGNPGICPPLAGYLQLRTCGCGNNCPSGSPPLFISCADYSQWVAATGHVCPVMGYSSPTTGCVSCWKVDWSGLPTTVLPPNAEVLQPGPFTSCCQCCAINRDQSSPGAGCCACLDGLTPGLCEETRLSYSGPASTETTTRHKYECCKKPGTLWFSGSMLMKFWDSLGNLTNEWSASGNRNIITYTEKVYSGGVLIAINTTREEWSECLFIGGQPIGGVSLIDFFLDQIAPSGSPGDTSNGYTIRRCDARIADYLRDNSGSGGSKVESRGSIIVNGFLGFCDPVECSPGLRRGCADCDTLKGVPVF